MLVTTPVAQATSESSLTLKRNTTVIPRVFYRKGPDRQADDEYELQARFEHTRILQ